MTSIGPYTESMNFRHMFDIPDLNSTKSSKNKVACPNTLTGIINNNPDFSKFKYILNLANLEGIYSDSQANVTLFVPSDNALKNIDNNVFINMDISTARHIVKSSTLRRRIPASVLMASPASWLITKDPPNRLFVTNMNNIISINNNINIIHSNIFASNGIIHVIDNLIWPDML